MLSETKTAVTFSWILLVIFNFIQILVFRHLVDTHDSFQFTRVHQFGVKSKFLGYLNNPSETLEEV